MRKCGHSAIWKIQLERSQTQRIYVRHSNREKKTFKYCIEKEKAMAGTRFEMRGSCEKSD